MGLYLGGLIIGRIFASEMCGAYFREGLLSEIYGISLPFIQVYACDTGKKRRPLKHGSLYGLPITAVKFFPFKDDQLITASKSRSLWGGGGGRGAPM